jgi:transcriptional regulator with PAS, ATPase and Fis domain
MALEWLDGIQAAVTVSDRSGIIVYMNEKSGQVFKDQGGLDLVGKSLFACHPPKANEQIRKMMENASSNVYTIEKAGVKKLIYQTPWMDGGECKGLVEISSPNPPEMPHFVRDPQ